MLGLAVATLLVSPFLCFGAPHPSLADFALQKVLKSASPILGQYSTSSSSTSSWMSRIPSDTQIIHMNIPGTHDSATWNYSQATQNALLPITNLNGVTEVPPEVFRCQQRPLIDMLNAGIRAFDLRYAFDATNTSLVFYHSQALLSESATMNDVLFGFYQWLSDHPSEAILLSLMYEGSTKEYAANDATTQMAVFEALTSPAARRYILQTKDRLGSLGEARGKIVLLRRFDLDQLPASYTQALPGLHFSPGSWTDNDPNITLVYNPAEKLTAYIEDFYEIDSPIGSPANTTIQWKYNATTAHMLKATEPEYSDDFFWTFASSEYNANVPTDMPKIQALGIGTTLTPLGGVNQRLLGFLRGLARGKRIGLVMFDFYDQPSDLVQALLDI